MSPLLRVGLPYLIGATLMVAAGATVRWYGSIQYQAGATDKQSEVEKRQVAIERAWQEEKDRADDNHRGAVLAREATERTVISQRGRIDGLLRQLAQRWAQNTGAGGRPDVAGPDWIGIIGSCVGDHEQMGKDAAHWADQVNGLQGYVRALQSTMR